jgi:hypothetical protein
MEYIPPTVWGLLPAASGSNPLGGIAPGATGVLTLPDAGDGTLDIPIINRCTQQTFDGEIVAVHYDVHSKRYIFLDRCERFFQYLLLTGWSGGLAVARRLSMDGVNSGKAVLLRDPLGVFSYQSAGDRGYMVYTVEDKFYAIQAPCDTNPTPPASPEACCYGSGCVNATAADCTAAGGIPQGPGTTCSDFPYPCGE